MPLTCFGASRMVPNGLKLWGSHIQTDSFLSSCTTCFQVQVPIAALCPWKQKVNTSLKIPIQLGIIFLKNKINITQLAYFKEAFSLWKDIKFMQYSTWRKSQRACHSKKFPINMESQYNFCIARTCYNHFSISHRIHHKLELLDTTAQPSSMLRRQRREHKSLQESGKLAPSIINSNPWAMAADYYGWSQEGGRRWMDGWMDHLALPLAAGRPAARSPEQRKPSKWLSR